MRMSLSIVYLIKYGTTKPPFYDNQTGTFCDLTVAAIVHFSLASCWQLSDLILDTCLFLLYNNAVLGEVHSNFKYKVLRFQDITN